MEERTSSTLMTEGSIWKRIIFFAIPLFLGNLFLVDCGEFSWE